MSDVDKVNGKAPMSTAGNVEKPKPAQEKKRKKKSKQKGYLKKLKGSSGPSSSRKR